ncbi:hypothetical protein [Lacihabitans soyangensis]|uniref:Uncharacterized protein n=1 Tax=Lacihabitans soyangensis TaxID=869394 RepID=A0AAE3KR89_9BACT|nr:hypothetical protein [Lacihabitans soyangensis]MCP9761992.1 hypothetical protein [Lacihabitans soyangensis]
MKILLILLTILNAGTLVPWAISAPMSLMAFDAPDSTKSVWPYLLIGAMVLYPIFVIFCIYKTWSQNSIYWAAGPTILFIIGLILINI